MLTHADIEERFMRAAEVDKLRTTVGGTGPARTGNGMPAYVHDWADMNGWGSERLKEERAQFFARLESKVTPKDISGMEECLRWTAELLDDPGQRRALWAWAAAKVGGGSFKGWCRRERIHPNTGQNRKNAAIRRMTGQLARCDGQRQFGVPNSMLPEHPFQPYLEPTFETLGQTEAKRPSWRDDPSLRPVFDARMQDMSWADKQNRRRRQRAGVKREKAA